jgi:tetratricopeptide (TPR) repeat protein
VLAAIGVLHARADAIRADFDAAVAAALRAVELAPELAAAHLALGYALLTGRLDIKGARAPYDRAAALGGGDADVLLLYALFCARDGRDADASKAVARALELDPVNARAWRAAGNVEYAARRHSEAIRLWQRALSIRPELSTVNALIGYALAALGKNAEARAALLKDGYDSFRLAGLAIVERRLGDMVAAQVARDRLVKTLGESALYQQAQIAAQWGESEVALTALERARAVNDAGMVYLKTDPFLDPVRKSPRFTALLRQIGFE